MAQGWLGPGVGRAIQSHPIPSSTIQYYPIPSYTIQYHPITSSNTTQCHSIPSNRVQYHQTLSLFHDFKHLLMISGRCLMVCIDFKSLLAQSYGGLGVSNRTATYRWRYWILNFVPTPFTAEPKSDVSEERRRRRNRQGHWRRQRRASLRWRAVAATHPGKIGAKTYLESKRSGKPF